MEFLCANWQDPENIGIKSYLLMSTDLATDVRAFHILQILRKTIRIPFKFCLVPNMKGSDRLKDEQTQSNCILHFKVISKLKYLYTFAV